MARSKNKAIDRRTGQVCDVIVFTRSRRGGPRLKHPREVVRCVGKKLRAHNRRQCRNRKKQFVKCR
jgi:hypothetical protein